MYTTKAENRFFESTRGQVIRLLRRQPRTVDEIASEVGLTDNAIRTHLATLERDGLVTQGEPRRGVGKPAFTYALTPQADRLFPKAYGVLLKQFLQVLGERLPRDKIAGALREVGHRVAEEQPGARTQGPSRSDLPERVESAIAVLGGLGGLAESERTDEGYIIKGYSCPLALAVEGHPDACLMAETMLSDIIGVSVHQRCDQGPPPRCCFEVPFDNQPRQDSTTDGKERPM